MVGMYISLFLYYSIVVTVNDNVALYIIVELLLVLLLFLRHLNSPQTRISLKMQLYTSLKPEIGINYVQMLVEFLNLLLQMILLF